LPRTQIFYEAPHRIMEALKDIVEVMGPGRHIVVAREVTKIHEEFLRGRAEDVLHSAEERGELKGEITLLIGKAEDNAKPAVMKETVGQMVRRMIQQESLNEKDALKRVAKELGIGKSEAYREWQRSKQV